MSITLDCPRCKATLSVSEKLAGQYAFCPKCEGRVWIARSLGAKATADSTQTEKAAKRSSSAASAGPSAATVVAQPKSAKTAGGAEAPKTVASAADPMAPVAPAPSRARPAPPGGTPPPPPNTPSTGARGVAPSGGAPPIAPTPSPSSQQAATPSAAQTPDTPTLQRPTRRVAQFITADVAQSQLELASDGRLPELQLTISEGKKKKKASDSANQWRMVALICISLAVSTFMLLADFGGDASDKRSPADAARDELGKYIGGEDEKLEPYQIYLREALVAHSRQDYRTERIYYRKVVDLLRAEHLDRDRDEKGITGQRYSSTNDPTLRSDERLEQLLSTLLKQR